MNKLLLAAILLFLFTTSLKAQSLGVSEFEFVAQKETVEKRCDALSAKGFIKEVSTPIRMVKKKFNKRQQFLFEEIITVTQDTVTYSFTDPKLYFDFKNTIDRTYKKIPVEGSDKIIFSRKHKEFVLYETNENRNGGEVRIYNFKFYLKNNG
jgi:hypothetical protein